MFQRSDPLTAEARSTIAEGAASPWAASVPARVPAYPDDPEVIISNDVGRVAVPTPPLQRVATSSAVMRKVSAGGRFSHYAAWIVNAALAAVLLVVVSPILLATALAIRLSDNGPVIFRHRRVGFGGRHFDCLKFRSMAVDAEQRLAKLLDNDPKARIEWERDHKLKVDPRVTKLGRFLRATSLDELPQLFNVVRGDMALVGPRPIVPGEVVKYDRWIGSYVAVRPGITGLWQVSGRNDVAYRRRVAMDVLYVRKRSPLWDVAILLGTIPAVLSRRGSY